MSQSKVTQLGLIRTGIVYMEQCGRRRSALVSHYQAVQVKGAFRSSGHRNFGFQNEGGTASVGGPELNMAIGSYGNGQTRWFRVLPAVGDLHHSVPGKRTECGLDGGLVFGYLYDYLFGRRGEGAGTRIFAATHVGVEAVVKRGGQGTGCARRDCDAAQFGIDRGDIGTSGGGLIDPGPVRPGKIANLDE